MKGSEIIVKTLSKLGVNTVFGYPGAAVLSLYEALSGSGISHVRTTHEQQACHAAAGYAKAGKRCGVVIATSGPGATNLLTGIADAYADSVPLLAITANVPIKAKGTDSFQEVAICEMTYPITKYSFYVSERDALQKTIMDAYSLALEGRYGPVLVDVPQDILEEECMFLPDPAPEKKAVPVFPDEKMRSVAALIEQASRPLMIVGGGVIYANACEEAETLARLTHTPVISTLKGLSALSRNSYPYISMAGKFGTPAANYALKNADLILALGTRFSDRLIAGMPIGKKTKVVHFDIDACEIDKLIYSDVGIDFDMKSCLNWLNYMYSNHFCAPKDNDFLLSVRAYEAKHKLKFGRKKNKDVRRLLYVLNELLPPECLIVTDVGKHQMWTAQFYKMRKGDVFITSGGLGTMGSGIASAIGAYFATGKKPVLITGDGSLRMSMSELLTAKEYHVPLSVIVIDNASLGMVYELQNQKYSNPYQTEIPQCDYVKIAKAMGYKTAKAASVSSAVKRLVPLLAEKEPALFDFVCEKDDELQPQKRKKENK